MITETISEKIERLRTLHGGFTRAALAELGVSWPQKKGWLRRLKRGNRIPEPILSPIQKRTIKVRSREYGNQMHKRLLKEFWDKFYPTTIGWADRPDYERLDALRAMAEVVIKYKKQSPLRNRRREFNKSKYSLLDISNGENRICFVCCGPSQVRHHIIQLQNGGINGRWNLVQLCHACHHKIHPWMKIRPESLPSPP